MGNLSQDDTPQRSIFSPTRCRLSSHKATQRQYLEKICLIGNPQIKGVLICLEDKDPLDFFGTAEQQNVQFPM